MCRRDFDHTRAKGRIDILIRDDRDLAITQRQCDELTHEVFVTLILRVHAQRGIAEQCFGTGGGDGQTCDGFAVALFVRNGLCARNEWIKDVPH